MQTKFYLLYQHCSGDKYLVNPRLGIGLGTIIEAASLNNAITRAKKLGIHDTWDGECEKCGKRWSFNQINESPFPTVNGYDKMDRLQYNLHYLHLRTGTFVELHRKHQFSIESAAEILNLNTEGKFVLRSSEILTLKSFINKDNKNPTLRALEPLREPPSLVPSKFRQHEILFKALQLQIIPTDVYHVMQKTTMTPKELEQIEKKILDKEPKKKKPTINWFQLSDRLKELEEQTNELTRATPPTPETWPWPSPTSTPIVTNNDLSQSA